MVERVAPFFTVVMPVHLGPYKGAAEDRVPKLHRAVESVIAQTFTDWELVIISDGCDIAWQELQRYKSSPHRIRFFKVPKKRQWSPEVRNTGLNLAMGKYAIYLDADDVYGPNHLSNVAAKLRANEYPTWGAMDELVWDPDGTWNVRKVEHLLANHTGNGWHAGTPNMVHRTDAGIAWPKIEFRHPSFGYGQEDRAMIQLLRDLSEPVYLPGSEYFVCHIPGQYDV